MSDKDKIPTFESLIADLDPDVREYLVVEFNRMGASGHKFFNTLFAIAYSRGRVDAATYIQERLAKANPANHIKDLLGRIIR